MDVKIASLNGDLNKEIYMEQPKGFVLLRNKKKVCKLVSHYMDKSKHLNNGMKSLMAQYLLMVSLIIILASAITLNLLRVME